MESSYAGIVPLPAPPNPLKTRDFGLTQILFGQLREQPVDPALGLL
jgi:hypothetical protein